MNKLFRYPVIFLDIVSPRRCLLCSCRLTHSLAHPSHKTYKWKVLEDYLCTTCLEELNVCSMDLIGVGQIDRVFSGYLYSDILAQIIPAWKYQGRSEFFPVIEAFVQQIISRFKLSESGFDLVTAIPLTKSSLRKRGFNQALFIAFCCAKVLDLPLLRHQFTKVIDTPHQASLDRDARMLNLNRDVFRVTGKADLEGCKILVCDDVMTTGSTLKAAAGALESAGAVSVTAMTLARVE